MNNKFLLTLVFLLGIISSCFAETLQTGDNKAQLQVTNPNVVATKANQRKSLNCPPPPTNFTILFLSHSKEGYYPNRGVPTPVGIYYDPNEQIKINKEYARNYGEEK